MMNQDIKTVIQYPVGATEFDIPFDYLSRKFVRVSLVADDNRRLLSNITEYRYVSKTRVKLLVETTGFDRVEIRRFTSASERVVDFSDGSVLRAADLNVSQIQSAHIAEEARDGQYYSLNLNDLGQFDAKGTKIINLGVPTSPQDATTKLYVDTNDLALSQRILDEIKARAEGDIEMLRQAKMYSDSQIPGILPDGATSVGYWLPSATALMNDDSGHPVVRVRGFYTADDGGEGSWVWTNEVDAQKAGTHDILTASVYDKVGRRYRINITIGAVNAAQNGARRLTYAQATDRTTDDFVCLGQVISGITSLMPLPVSTNNSESGYIGDYRINLTISPGRYRIGKESGGIDSGMVINAWGARVHVVAGKSYTRAITGKWIHGLVHGYDQIKRKWEAVGKQAFWGSVSLKDVVINGGFWIGDHDLRTPASECSAGVGTLLLNPEGVIMNGVHQRNFNWVHVAMGAMIEETWYRTSKGRLFDDNELDYPYVMDFMTSNVPPVTRRFGNFNRVAYHGCKFESGRRGVFRNGVDWSGCYNTEIINNIAWRNPANADGSLPEFIAVLTGTAFHMSAGYMGPAAAKDLNAGVASVYSSTQNIKFDATYTEWTYAFMMISSWGFVDSASRLQGLSLDLVSVYKDNFADYGQIIFEEGCFPTMSEDGSATYPAGFKHFDTPQGQSPYVIGKPVRDVGAFRNQGFDFKYATNNVYLTAGTDWESWRDRPYAREMFNAFGLQINSGTAFLPLQNPADKSMTCIWYKDFTGNFDTRKVIQFITAAAQEGPNADEALYKSYAERVVDFGNGYKMMMIPNKRLTAWDGIYTYARNANITVEVSADTPIALIAVEAYTGGVPLFPNGVPNYVPESSCASVVPTAPQVGFDSNLGGGIFFDGDVVGPWVHVRRNKVGRRITPQVTAGSVLSTRRVSGQGITLESALKTTFTATIVSSNADTTTISIQSASLPSVAVGIPLYVQSGSSTGFTGLAHLHLRVMLANGKADNKYVVNGKLGEAGDNLTIDQSQIAAYTLLADFTQTAITAETMTLSGVARASAFRASVGVDVGYGGSSGPKVVAFYFNGGTTQTHAITATSLNGMSVNANGNLSINGHTFSTQDGTHTLGTAQNRWAAVWSANGTLQTSDERFKILDGDIPEELLDAWERYVKVKVYRMKSAVELKGPDARKHVGYIAQHVIEALTQAGLDWTKYGVVGFDEWEANSFGPAGNRYSLRYDQCAAIENAVLDRRIRRLEELLLNK
ncbi:tail spike protein [Klebsiella phage vB_Kpn_K27PH129C1]|uniref:Probable tail spike protein n=1 Tax=Klebsiella phage vB_Kpn_K27PH129C1 TaxID=3071640 RepID=A0AAV1MFL0_9CAUD|nr:tail spike protein [Klebsiella phage vB_Kpn_K27PH129C1]